MKTFIVFYWLVNIIRSSAREIPNEPIHFILPKKEHDTNRYLTALNCPISPSDWNPYENYDDDEINDSHRFSVYSTGDLGRKLIKLLRGKSKPFYQEIVDNAIMTFCDLNTAKDRCVDSVSPFAAKDWEDKCIVASDFTCPQGMCERTSNCFWRSVVPGEIRETRFPEEDYENAREKLIGLQTSSYIRGVAFFAAIGVVIGCVLFIIWSLFLVGRYCCCCLWTSWSICFLCSPIPKTKGYRVCLDLVIPILLYMICILGISVSAAVAFIGDEDVSIASTNMFSHSSGLAEDFGEFLGRAITPLRNIDEIVQDAALDSKNIFDDTDYVYLTASKIMDSFLDFGVLHGKGLEASNAQEYFTSAYDGFNEQVSPIVTEVESMLDTLENDLYTNVDTIQNSIVSAIAQTESIYNVTNDYQHKIYTLEGQELTARPIRKIIVLTIFIVSLVFVILGLLGIFLSKITGKSAFLLLLNLTGLMSAVIGCLALILAGVLLSVNIVWHDTCEMSQIVTADFEPFLGDKVAPGANACFNDTNLAVAFNISDKVDFQAKLDQSLEILTEVNVTEIFDTVLTPVEGMQDMIETITTTALKVLNIGTSSAGIASCPFQDRYTKESILEPWTAHLSGSTTDWILKSTGTVGSYDRENTNESPLDYMTRIYNIAGICTDSTNCCLEDKCGLAPLEACNKGSDCIYPCDELYGLILLGYSSYWTAYNMEQDMTSDLGVICPENRQCPSIGFQNVGNEHTLLELLELYETNITATTNDLVDLASTSVGNTMEEVQTFLCNMNVSFVEKRYDQIQDDLCVSMFGGITQLFLGLLLLGLCLQVTAVLAHILCVRLRGLTRRAAKMASEYGDGLSMVDVYS